MKRLTENDSVVIPRETVGTRREPDLPPARVTAKNFEKHSPNPRKVKHEWIGDKLSRNIVDIGCGQDRIAAFLWRRKAEWRFARFYSD